MEALAELLAWAREATTVAGIVFIRVGAMMFLLPAFGELLIPARVRLGLALAFTAIVTPAVVPVLQPVAEGSSLLVVLGAETIVGLVIGLVVRFFAMALQIAGSMAAHATSLAQILGDAGIDPQPAIGQLLSVGGLALAVAAGLHVRFAELMIHSYDVFRPGVLPGPALVSEWGIARIAAAFSLAFALAAPFTIAAFVYNLALGVINRAMPQLMVTFVGAPAITLGALALLMLSAPILLGLWHEGFTAFLADPFEGR
jgi:flagellar biosynthetic protein FliR